MNVTDSNTTHSSVLKDTGKNESETVLIDGYDLPVYGLDTGQFYTIHIMALICIFTSLICALAVIISSFRSEKQFFKWTKSERFAVYLALCDGLFNLFHSMDHLQIVITRNHVHPTELCQFYGFMISEFISAQNILVFIIAVNAFMLIYFRKSLDFGDYDWILITTTFGIPFVAATVAVSFGMFGPTGAFCLYDGVKAYLVNLFYTTVPLLLVLFINSVLYLLTWKKIKSESKKLKDSLGKEAKSIKASHTAAKTMSLFVAVFFIQWWAISVFAVWQLLSTHVPVIMFQITTIFTNIGGILNGIVYIIIQRRKSSGQSERKREETTPAIRISTVELSGRVVREN